MSEFDLIAALLEELGDEVGSADTVLGPGDDCAVSRVPDGHELVSSIDTLVAGVHFPTAAPAPQPVYDDSKQRADKALYASKSRGRNRFSVDGA